MPLPSHQNLLISERLKSHQLTTGKGIMLFREQSIARSYKIIIKQLTTAIMEDYINNNINKDLQLLIQ